MAMTAAERQKKYRERLKAKAAAGDERAINQIQKNRKQSSTSVKGLSGARTFIKLHANLEQLDELKNLIADRENYLKAKIINKNT